MENKKVDCIYTVGPEIMMLKAGQLAERKRHYGTDFGGALYEVWVWNLWKLRGGWFGCSNMYRWPSNAFGKSLKIEDFWEIPS